MTVVWMTTLKMWKSGFWKMRFARPDSTRLKPHASSASRSAHFATNSRNTGSTDSLLVQPFARRSLKMRSLLQSSVPDAEAIFRFTGPLLKSRVIGPFRSYSCPPTPRPTPTRGSIDAAPWQARLSFKNQLKNAAASVVANGTECR